MSSTSSTSSSRFSQQSQKPVIVYGTRQPSTSSRTSDSTFERTPASYTALNRSDRSPSMSGNHRSSSRSEVFREDGHIYKFRAYDADNFEGTYKYSKGIKIINHNAPTREDRKLVHSSHATYEDYTRTQQYEKRH